MDKPQPRTFATVREVITNFKREVLIDRAVRRVVFERGKVTNDPVYKTDWFMIADWFYVDICKEVQNQQMGLISSGGIGNPPFNEWVLPIHGRDIEIPPIPHDIYRSHVDISDRVKSS